MQEKELTDEQWFQMYTDVTSHQFGDLQVIQPPQEKEIIDLVDEVTEVVDNTQLISDMIEEELSGYDIVPVNNNVIDFKPYKRQKELIPQLIKSDIYLRCINEDCTSTARLINLAAGCRLSKVCNACGSPLELRKE